MVIVGATSEQYKNREELNKNFLDQVIIKFDFPLVFQLAQKSPDGKRLVTAGMTSTLQNLRAMLEKKFPIYNPVIPKSINVELNQGSLPVVQEFEQELVHSFKTLDGEKLIEASANSFVFATRGGDQYTNFEDFVEVFNTLWNEVAALLDIKVLLKFGLRKVNVFNEANVFEKSFIKSLNAQLLPPISEKNKNIACQEFGARQVFKLDGYTCNYQYGLDPRGNADGRVFYLDTDIFYDEPIAKTDVVNKLKYVNNIHWGLYSSSLSNEFYEYLRITAKK